MGRAVRDNHAHAHTLEVACRRARAAGRIAVLAPRRGAPVLGGHRGPCALAQRCRRRRRAVLAHAGRARLHRARAPERCRCGPRGRAARPHLPRARVGRAAGRDRPPAYRPGHRARERRQVRRAGTLLGGHDARTGERPAPARRRAVLHRRARGLGAPCSGRRAHGQRARLVARWPHDVLGRHPCARDPRVELRRARRPGRRAVRAAHFRPAPRGRALRRPPRRRLRGRRRRLLVRALRRRARAAPVAARRGAGRAARARGASHHALSGRPRRSHAVRHLGQGPVLRTRVDVPGLPVAWCEVGGAR